MRSDDQSFNPFVELAGYFPHPQNKMEVHTLKELVVFRNPPVIQIYNVTEYGRRHLRQLIYTSNSSLCLHDIKGDPYPDKVKPAE